MARYHDSVVLIRRGWMRARNRALGVRDEASSEESGRSESYRLAWHLQDQEATRFWQRNNAFLLIHAGLLAVLTASSPPVFVQRVVGILGIVLALIWLAVLDRGKIYVYRWNKVIDRIEDERDASIGFPLHEWYEEAKQTDPRPQLRFWWARGETTDLMRRGIYTVIIAWLIVTIYAWWDLLSELPPKIQEIVSALLSH